MFNCNQVCSGADCFRPCYPAFKVPDFTCSSSSGLKAGLTTTCAGTVSYDAAGTYNLYAEVDKSKTVMESNESNNVLGPQTISVVSGPDLVVQSIVTNPVSPAPGQSVSVTLTIKNQGDVNTSLGVVTLPDSGFYVDFYKHLPAGTTPDPPGDAENFHCQLRGNPFGDTELAPGETVTCSGTVSYSAVGTYNMWAYVDSTLGTQESNESNNAFGPQTITVSPPCVLNTYYQDADGDGYGNPSVTTQACTAPAGYVGNNTDCNDTNAGVHPGAAEICDGLDNNCNGNIDEKASGHILFDENTVALWRLNEASASSNAVDEAGIYHLSQFGSPDVITGQIGNGRLLNGSSKFFERQGNASLGTALNGDWTYEGWVYLDPSFSAQGQLFIYNGPAFSFNEPDTILAEVGIMANRKFYWHQWQSMAPIRRPFPILLSRPGNIIMLQISRRTAQGGNLFTYRIYVNGILDTTTTGVTGLSYRRFRELALHRPG